MIQLNQRSKTPLYEQIYEQLQRDILNGTYPPKSPLPSIRSLAESLFCSRNTVEAAYRLLMQEGFIQSKPGSGYTVGEQMPDGSSYADRYQQMQTAEAADAALDELDDNQPLDRCSAPLAQARYDFTYGNLQPGTFPALEWKSITDDVLLSVDSARADSYTDSEGETKLRRVIARMLAANRDIHCDPEQVIIQGGTQAALQNLLTLFNPVNDTVAMEEPGYDGARSVFERSHFTVHPCPVYLQPSAYMDAVRRSQAKLLYTTPSNQFPLGLVMSMESRTELIEWASETNAYIIEDDYCYEYNYRAQPLRALQSMDSKDRVIYMGTFSKSLSPALRMNYLVLPPRLLDRWCSVFAQAYPAVSWLSQEVCARYLSSPQRERQLRRVQLKSRRKHELLLHAIEEHLGGRVEVIEGGAGLHMLVRVIDGRSQGELIALAREAGVRIYETDRYWMAEEHPLPSTVLVGFSAIPEESIEPGIAALAHAWFD